MTVQWSLTQNTQKLILRAIGTIAYTYDIIRLSSSTNTEFHNLTKGNDIFVSAGFGPNPVGISIEINSPEAQGPVELETSNGILFETFQVDLKKGNNTILFSSDIGVTTLRIGNRGNKSLSGFVQVGPIDAPIALPNFPVSGGGGGGTITDVTMLAAMQIGWGIVQQINESIDLRNSMQPTDMKPSIGVVTQRPVGDTPPFPT